MDAGKIQRRDDCKTGCWEDWPHSGEIFCWVRVCIIGGLEFAVLDYQEWTRFSFQFHAFVM